MNSNNNNNNDKNNNDNKNNDNNHNNNNNNSNDYRRSGTGNNAVRKISDIAQYAVEVTERHDYAQTQGMEGNRVESM